MCGIIEASAHVKIHLYNLDINNGLSNNHVNCILKDSNGYVWIGTEYGLNRYDGYRFKQYFNDKRNNELWSSCIVGLQQDKLGTIWIQLQWNSYVIYKYKTDKIYKNYKSYLNALGIHTNADVHVYVDPDKNLWVTDRNTVFYYNFVTRILKRYNIRDARDIKKYKDFAYIINKRGIIYTINTHNGKILINDYVFKKTKTQFDEFMLYIDTDQGVWAYSIDNAGLFHYNANRKVWDITYQQKGKSLMKDNQVKSIIDDRQGNILIASEHHGLYIYSLKEHKYISDKYINDMLKSNNINCLYTDPNGIMWIGYNKKGLSYVVNANSRFDSFCVPGKSDNEYNNDVSSLMVDHDGNIWIGTDGNGLTIIDKNQHIKNHYNFKGGDNSVLCIYQDRRGRVWVSAYRSGLYCFTKGHIIHYTDGYKGLSDNNVWSITSDDKDNLWVGELSRGIQRYNEQKGCFTTVANNYSVMRLCNVVKGWIYAATAYGYLKINTNNNHYCLVTGNKRHNQDLIDKTLQDITIDKRGLIWACGINGLSIYDERHDYIYYLNKENGLCYNVTQGVVEDNNGHLWVTTANGLSEIEVGSKGGRYIFHVNNYFERDGLKNVCFSKGAIIRTPSGLIYIGSINGYNVIKPQLASKNISRLKVCFTDLQINNEYIKVDSSYKGRVILDSDLNVCDKVVLKYSDRLISISFSALDFNSIDHCQYAYQLVSNSSSNWIYTENNEVTFDNLSPGTYFLRVKACNGDGQWGSISTLKIKVLPPFWLSNLAYILYLFVLVSIIISIYVIAKRRHLFMLHIENLKIEIKKQHQVDNIKFQFFTNISHDLRTPLSLIISPIEKLLEDYKGKPAFKTLDVIHRNAVQVISLVNQLLDFRKLDEMGEDVILSKGDYISYIAELCENFEFITKSQRIKLIFKTNVRQMEFQFDKDKIKKIMMNLLSNSFKFSDANSVITVEIIANEEYVLTSVKDTGIGIPDHEKNMVFDRFYQIDQSHTKYGNGIGLYIVSKYIKMLNGEITITDNVPHGCIFTFKLRLSQKKLPLIKEEQIVKQEKNDEVKNVAKGSDVTISHRPLILIVEDNDDFLDFMDEYLGSYYNIIRSSNGKEAINILYKRKVDIIITDIMMPVMDGIELCHNVKNDINLSHIPIIMLTAKTAEEHRIEGLAEGADDYLTKPCNLYVLKLRIEKILQWSQHNHDEFKRKVVINPSKITISSLDEKLIEKAIKVCEDNIDNSDFSVEDLSERVNMSRANLYRKLLNITGKSPSEFILIIRLKRSLQYLEKSQMTISEIAYSLGFATPRIFSKHFKEEYGLSPSEYMKKNGHPNFKKDAS